MFMIIHNVNAFVNSLDGFLGKKIRVNSYFLLFWYTRGDSNPQPSVPKMVDRLVEFLQKSGIKNIAVNDPFNGGGTIRTVYDKTSIKCVQLEINCNYRNIRKINNMKKNCKALSIFIGDL